MGDFLETSAAERLGWAPAAPAHLDAGEVVGDFTVLGVLGEGGGGVVHEAMQREPVRRVALKIVRARSRDEASLRAFRDEAANQARLQHPGIAHVYAAGVDDRFGSWIAMELVHAACSIVRYAEDGRLPLGARLRLFLGVREAIHHAHQKGVIPGPRRPRGRARVRRRRRAARGGRARWPDPRLERAERCARPRDRRPHAERRGRRGEPRRTAPRVGLARPHRAALEPRGRRGDLRPDVPHEQRAGRCVRPGGRAPRQRFMGRHAAPVGRGPLAHAPRSRSRASGSWTPR